MYKCAKEIVQIYFVAYKMEHVVPFTTIFSSNFLQKVDLRTGEKKIFKRRAAGDDALALAF